jgi:transcriptional regulator with XRE-family HTH domain
VLAQLKAAPEAKGLSLADLTELTGMDRSALSKLETGQRANPTVETLVRYADAAGKRPAVSLADAQNGGMAVACWDSRTKKAALLEALRLVAPWSVACEGSNIVTLSDVAWTPLSIYC